jgi:hypothetical protein
VLPLLLLLAVMEDAHRVVRVAHVRHAVYPIYQ